MSKKRYSKSQNIFQLFNYIMLTILGFIMLVPLLSVLSTSLSSPGAVDARKVFITPVEFTFGSWQYILSLESLWRSLAITVAVTFGGTFIALALNALMAYPLSKKEFALSRAILMLIVISMIFKAPVIPYFLTVKSIGLFDNFLVLILPHLFVSFNLIILVTFLRQVPKELEESAMLEGCGYVQILFRIILPSSKAACATVGLFYAVMIWNQFSNPLLFIQNFKLYPLQLLIRSFVSEGELATSVAFRVGKQYNDQTVKAASIIFSVMPIVMVYPVLQKYFIKGAMIGSIKG